MKTVLGTPAAEPISSSHSFLADIMDYFILHVPSCLLILDEFNKNHTAKSCTNSYSLTLRME
jgi:hypothetical protein